MRLSDDHYPLYSAEGRPLGFRSREATQRLLDGGFVFPAFGRKGHLKAVFLAKEDGSSPVHERPEHGPNYSFQERLPEGHRCWKFKRLDLVDENGVQINTGAIYRRVLIECLAR